MAKSLAWIVTLAISVNCSPAQETSPQQIPPDRLQHQPSPGAPVSFVNDVRSAFNKLGCNATECHGAAKGKGGLKLSLFGAEPQLDYEALTKSSGGRRINRIEPEKSLFLLKATQTLSHKAQMLPVESPEYRLLVSWIDQGTPYTYDKEPELVSLQVSPSEQILRRGESQQLTVRAGFSDGTWKEVTREASYTTSDEKVAAVAAGGKAQANDLGESIIVVNYLRKAATVRLLVPQPLPQLFPKREANNKVDEFVHAKLRLLGLPPSELCSEAEFLRRVYLDVIGLLPSPPEARAFLSDVDARKRSKLIDRLLAREEFADFWALKWGDLLRIKSEYPVRVWPKAVQVYYRWVRASLAGNKPYDQFARELLTASGSNFREGAANFCRAVPSKDPQTIAESAALIFMGARVGCARCHGHPAESWDLQDDLGLAAFFAKVGFKSTLEWKEEIVLFNPKGTLLHPRTKEIVKPKFLGGAVWETGPEDDPRARFAAWLTAPQNPWFARNIANRVWFWLLGRGIVHEPDDLRPTNPPENPELLEYLAQELVSHRYDLQHLYRLILNSRTYQLSSKANPWNAHDTAHFSHYQMKRLGAEQLSDAICQVTETAERFQSIIPEPFTFLPPGHRATQLFDGNIGTAFLELFGRPPRDTPYEGERNSETSLWQALYFINSDQLEGKVVSSPRLKRLLKASQSDAAIIDEVYLAALSRLPEEEEKQKVLGYVAKNQAARAQAIGDLVWALLNTKEFVFVR
ncbi:MAG: DUF1553 domain-containing protein [Chloroflexi bacterium]|nr:DUF1553 domain-containing protein [Chloroflexota bacterium]